jgi:outer membrane lipoprotein-sorting protein
MNAPVRSHLNLALLFSLACAAWSASLAFRDAPASAVQEPLPSPRPTAAPLEATPAGAAKYVSDFAQAWASVTSYTATVTVFEQKGTQVQNLIFDYTFRKPSTVTVHVVYRPNAGAILSWDGGTTLVATRGRGLLALFKKTYPLHDAQVTTIRGSSIDQLSFGAILADAQQAGVLSEAPSDAIDGVAADAVELIPAASPSDVGLTREVVDLSSITHLPMRVLGFDGSTLVIRIGFTNVMIAGS